MSRVDRIKAEIGVLQGELLDIQCCCSHPGPALEYRYKASTGGYDRGSDAYWTEYHCTLCDKRWSVDSEQPGYHPPEGAKKVD